MGKALPPEQHCRTADLQLLRNGAVVLPLIAKIARIYSVTKEITLTAAKYGAQLKDITIAELARRGPKKPETEEEKLERICENRRRQWDCFHLATAKILDCEYLYSNGQDSAKEAATTWNRPAGSFA